MLIYDHYYYYTNTSRFSSGLVLVLPGRPHSSVLWGRVVVSVVVVVTVERTLLLLLGCWLVVGVLLLLRRAHYYFGLPMRRYWRARSSS